jgi:hypothetical protein
LKTRGGIALWLGMAVGLGLLWLAIRSVDLDGMRAALQRARLAWALPFLALLAGFYALKAVRWGQLLRPIAAVPFRLLYRAVIIGYASNALLPAQLGDIVRALVASREMGLRLAPILTTLVVERVLDLVVVVGLLAVTVVLRPDVPDVIALAGLAVAALCAIFLPLLYSYGRHTAAWLSVLDRLAARLPASMRELVMSQLRAGADGAHALATPGRFAAVVGVSFAKWLLIAGCNLISVLALGIDVPAAAAILVLACTVLALLLPSAPGYVGAIQIAYVLALAPFGVSATDAVAASLFFHVFAYGFVVLAGWYYMHASGYRLADLRQQVDRPPG